MRAAVVFLIYLYLISGALSQHCRSTLGWLNTGTCVPIYQCPHLHEVFQERQLSRYSMRFIQSFICGKDYRGILVCCPGLYQNEQIWTITQSKLHQNQSSISDSWEHNTGTSSGQIRTTATTPLTITTSGRPEISTSSEHFRDKDWKPSPVGQCGKQGAVDRIYGGVATELDEFPWLALMFYRNAKSSEVKKHCGGALLNRRYILTAAHCVDGKDKLEFVRLGEYDIESATDCKETGGKRICADPPQDMRVEEIFLHPGYNRSMSPSLHDIAIIKLAHRVHYNSFVQPICLPESKRDLSGEDGGFVMAGWGKSFPVVGVPVKQKVHLPIFDHALCTNIYLKYVRSFRITKDQMCAGGEFSEDACDGDSGMPLMRQTPAGHWEASGVMSFGHGCGMDEVPAVYTNVRSYLDWIRVIMKKSYSPIPRF